MVKLSVALAVLGLSLLLISALPGRTAAPATATNLAPAVATAGDAAYGKALFSAKGCVTCHHHDAVPGSGAIQIGPDLTTRRLDPGYLRTWLKDPPAVKPGTEMPNLGLKSDEIEALVAFLNTSSTK
jgi:cytochrome c